MEQQLDLVGCCDFAQLLKIKILQVKHWLSNVCYKHIITNEIQEKKFFKIFMRASG